MGRSPRRRCLRHSGRADPLAAFPDAPYRRAGDGRLGRVESARRSIRARWRLIACPRPDAACRSKALPIYRFDRPLPIGLDAAGWARLGDTRRRALRAAIATSGDPLGAPRGFGAAARGATPAFPLDLAVPPASMRLPPRIGGADWRRNSVSRRARCSASAPASRRRATISSARAVRRGARAGVVPHLAATRRSADRCARPNVRTRSARRSSPISRAARASSRCTTLAAALARRAAGRCGRARRRASLTAIGHSSGWDMLTGFLLGVTAPAYVNRRKLDCIDHDLLHDPGSAY